MQYFKINAENVAIEGRFDILEGNEVPTDYRAASDDTCIGHTWSDSGWVAPIPSILEFRTDRNNILKTTDWAVMADSPLSEDQKVPWITYRQYLRDLLEGYDGTVLVRIDSPTGKQSV